MCFISRRYTLLIMSLQLEAIAGATKDIHRSADVLQRYEWYGLAPVKPGSRISAPLRMPGAGLCTGSGRGSGRTSTIRPRRRRALMPVSSFGRTETQSVFNEVETGAGVEVEVCRQPRNTLSQSRPSACSVTVTYFVDILGITVYAQTAYGIPRGWTEEPSRQDVAASGAVGLWRGKS